MKETTTCVKCVVETVVVAVVVVVVVVVVVEVNWQLAGRQANAG